MVMKQYAHGIIVGLSLATSTIFAVTTKHECEVFGKWHLWQQVFEHKNIAQLADTLTDDSAAHRIKNQYEHYRTSLGPVIPFLSKLSNQSISTSGYQFQTPLDAEVKNNFSMLYHAIEHDMPQFIGTLALNGITSPENQLNDAKEPVNITIEKYKALASFLLMQEDPFQASAYSLAFANKMFEYAYYNATFPHYQNLLSSHHKYPLARFVNTTLWYNLVGDGWKQWHKEALDGIRTKAAQGNEIVYLAGGTDIYQFLREGMYAITIIDPFLPTQAPYYSEGWAFLLEGENLGQGIGDCIQCGPDCKSIRLQRARVQEYDTFTSKLSNKTVATFKKSTVTWDIYDAHNKPVGHVIIHRRPVVQSDLSPANNVTLVASYDELTYMAMPDILNGWGIDPSLIPATTEIYVKQLRKPVNRDIMCNIRIASLLNFTDLRFINLASDPT